ncbi:lysozyme inhibitor LprI family protein [Pseudomonas purpurea]|uniref:lysozyme inhibitor LprI family protein n=1 Tax=Pseudomonas purpurea TaxID=3136737 RepID=UPI003264473E
MPRLIVQSLIAGMLAASVATGVVASSTCNPDSLTNPDIITCSQQTLDRLDRVLNEQYKALVGESSGPRKSDLLSVQRSWLAFRDPYCEAVYQSTFPGQEAPIDKIACLTQLTSARVNELVNLRSGFVGDGFYKVAAVLGAQSVQSFQVLPVGVNPQWDEYASQHCAMTRTLLREETSRCLARMQFHLPIN